MPSWLFSAPELAPRTGLELDIVRLVRLDIFLS
jgi:hypothetical protein